MVKMVKNGKNGENGEIGKNGKNGENGENGENCKYPINSKITRGLNFFFLPKIAGYFRVRIIFECGLNSFFFFLTRNKCLFLDQKEFIMVIFCCN